MPRKKLRLHPKAFEEAETAHRWYAERNRVAAQSFLFELDHSVGRVAESPERWPKYGRGARRYVFPRFPFSLIYRIKEDIVEVVAIAHHKRKPGYWRYR